jgi:hypothetical protein
MYRFFCFLSLLFGCLLSVPAYAQTGHFVGHELTWVSPDTLVFPFDGTPNFVVRVVNQGSEPSPDGFSFQFSSPDYPNPGGGFATFPNGGFIKLAPAETTWVQSWSSGVYEQQAPNGFFEREIIFRFIVSRGAEGQDEYALPKRITFENLGRPTPTEAFAGPMGVSGVVRNGSGMVRAEIKTPFSDALNIPIQPQNDGTSTFSTSIRERDDWLLLVWSDHRLQQVIPLFPGETANLDITLEELPTDFPQFELEKGIETPTGFWRGAVSESEGTFVAFPGQENWVRTGDSVADSTLMTTGRVQKYTFDGQLLWEHEPGWEIWGGDMSTDGRWVAYVINPTHWPFRQPSLYRMVVLDGLTGEPVWTVEESLGTPVGRLLESLELGMSADGRYVAVGGTAGGQVGLFDVQAQELIWSIPEGQGWGQIRKLAFQGDYLYVGSGDDYLRKVQVSDGQLLWRAYIGGWPFVMGYDRQGEYIYTGTKSKHLTKVRDSDGHVVWQKETQNLDAYADPAGRWVAGFGPQIYDAETGEIKGLAFLATKHFLSGGNYFITADRSVAVHDLSGQILSAAQPSGVAQGPGEQSQWSYLTEDEQRVIILGRDMGNPPQPGIAIYRRMASGVARETNGEVPQELEIRSAYPNPFSDHLTIDVEATPQMPVEIELFDVLGRRVMAASRSERPARSRSILLDTAGLAPGVYLMRLTQGSRQTSRSLVKMR